MAIDLNDYSANDPTDNLSVKDLLLKVRSFWRYLISKSKIIMIAVIIGGTIGVIYSFFAKPVYRAKLTFALDDDKASNGGFGAAMNLASQFGVDLGSAGGGGAFLADNLLELMQSRLIVEKALLMPIDVNKKTQTLAEFYISFKSLRKKWNKAPQLNKIQFLPHANRSQFTVQQDSILGILYGQIVQNNLTVDRLDKKSSIITVLVESEDQYFSKAFAEAITSTVSNFYIDTKTKKSIENVDILQKQTDSVRHELNSALTGVASSVDVNPNANPSLQILRVPSQKRQVDVQANQAILAQLVANLEMAKVSLRKETPLVQLIDEPILPLEKHKVGNIKGFFVGAIIAGLLAVMFIFFDRVFKKIMSSGQ